MNTIPLERAIQEVCKYITKTESFLRIPASELMPVVLALKRKRMVEPFGECHRSYVHTHNRSDGKRKSGGRGVPPLARSGRQRPLRKIGEEMIASNQRPEWLLLLRRRVQKIRDFRQEQLAESHREAAFASLDGTTWYGKTLRNSVLDAPRAVDLFAGVGVKEFAVTVLKEQNQIGKRGLFYQRLQTKELYRLLPSYVRRNHLGRESLIVRPLAHNLIQVDDCVGESLRRIAPFAFLVVETSLGNYQAWLALDARVTKVERDAIRSKLLAGLADVDRNASGALRLPGTLNHKPGRGEFRIRIAAFSQHRRFVSTDELEAAGILAPIEKSSREVSAYAFRTEHSSTRMPFPDYERCLDEAPRKSNGSPDRSIADKNWAILALGRGKSEEAVESKLAELSEKAKGRPDYVRRTVAYAALVVSRNSLRPVGAQV